MWSGFHKKALLERRNQLRLVFPTLFDKDTTSLNTHLNNIDNSNNDYLATTAPAESIITSTRMAADVEREEKAKSGLIVEAPGDIDNNSQATTKNPNLNPHINLNPNNNTNPNNNMNSIANIKNVGSSESVTSLLEMNKTINASSSLDLHNWPIKGLDDQIANNMIENCIGYINPFCGQLGS
jgi:hypothetical protein